MIYYRCKLMDYHLITYILDKLNTLTQSHRPRLTELEFKLKQGELITRACKFLRFNSSDWVSIALYIDRLSEIPSQYFLNDRNSSYILLALIILHQELYDDWYYSNGFFIRMARINGQILYATEIAILFNIHLVITTEQYEEKSLEIEAHKQLKPIEDITF